MTDYVDLASVSGKKKRTFAEFSDILEQKAREQRVPIHGQFELTPLCNLDCKMCYVHLQPEQMGEKRLLPVPVWKDLIRQAYKAGMLNATLTGGECLTYPGFEELFLYLHSLGCQVNVLTNGVLLDEERIRFFMEHMPAKIQITLYGHDEDTYEAVTGKRVFARVLDAIHRCEEAQLPLALCVTPSRFLGEEVFETIRIAKENCRAVNINSSLFDPFKETGRAGHVPDVSAKNRASHTKRSEAFTDTGCTGQKSDADEGVRSEGNSLDVDMDLYCRIYRYVKELDGDTVEEFPEELLPEPGGPFRICDECGLLCGGGRSTFTVNWKGIMHPCNRLNRIEGYPLRDGFEEAWRQLNRAADTVPQRAGCKGCPYEPVCDNCAGKIEAVGEEQIYNKLCRKTKLYVQQGICKLP